MHSLLIYHQIVANNLRLVSGSGKMRCVLLLVLCCLVWECYSSPIQIVENHGVTNKAKAVAQGRQAAGSEGVAAAAAAEDDDDDDDDDDIEDALVEDDDDDDEEETPQAAPAAAAAADDDDDDDEDYLERIFDDILDEDDDDDDDDVSPSTGVLQQTQQQAAAQPAISEPAVATGISEGDSPAGLNVDYPSEGEQTVFYDEENGGIDTKVDVQALSKPQEQVASNLGQKVSASQQAANEVANASDDDDDDDDEDEIAGALDDDDDDDDDDEEDDLIGDDVIEAKRSRSLEKQNSIPEVLTHRYNRFVDGIFARINKILKESYDPVRVRLSVGGKQTKSASSHSNTNTKRKTKSKSKRKPKAEAISDLAENKSENQIVSEEVPAPNSIPVGIPQKFITSPEQSDKIVEERTTKLKHKKTATSATRKPSKNSLKKNSDEKVRKAQGTLYGLASLKRIGNVRVIPEGNNSTIKSKFTLGPLTLKVEKSFKRGTVRNVKSATARTNEMVGRVNLRVVDGAATLVSIKVQQPKQVQVESSDNHDRTREFVWKRTPHIAHLVSDKLRTAARSLLKPVRTQVVHQ